MRALLVGLCAVLSAASKLDGVHRLSFADVERFNGDCPCSDASLCAPITATYEKEVFGFLSSEKKGADNSSWVNLDFNQITTVAWDTSPELICEAHRNGVRVVANTPRYGLGLGSNKTALDAWVKDLVTMVQGTFIDGVVFDYEYPIFPFSDGQQELVNIVAATTGALHAAIPTSQTSVCVPFVPDHDNRYYDFKGMADASDIFYIMFYDTQTSIYGQCIAGPGASLSLAAHALDAYAALGVPANKTVLGVPWYAHDYECIPGTDPKAEFCKIPDGPGYRGAQCSYIGHAPERHFAEYMDLLNTGNTTTGRLYNNATDSPYFNYVGANGTVHQVWMEDAESLTKKYQYVLKRKIRGTGPFQFSDLDYSTNQTREQAQSMWDALKVFTGK